MIGIRTAARLFWKCSFKPSRAIIRSIFPRDHRIVLLDKRPIGMTDIARGKTEVRVLDIILKPESRNAGISTTLMRAVMDEADKSGKAI